MTEQTKQILSRRSFIQASALAGGGLIIGFSMPSAMAATIGARPQSTTTAAGTEINAWLVIDRDNTVTMRIPHTEMGQGGLTSVALLIAKNSTSSGRRSRRSGRTPTGICATIKNTR